MYRLLYNYTTRAYLDNFSQKLQTGCDSRFGVVSRKGRTEELFFLAELDSKSVFLKLEYCGNTFSFQGGFPLPNNVLLLKEFSQNRCVCSNAKEVVIKYSASHLLLRLVLFMFPRQCSGCSGYNASIRNPQVP